MRVWSLLPVTFQFSKLLVACQVVTGPAHKHTHTHPCATPLPLHPPPQVDLPVLFRDCLRAGTTAPPPLLTSALPRLSPGPPQALPRLLEEVKAEPSTWKTNPAHLQPPAGLEHCPPPFAAPSGLSHAFPCWEPHTSKDPPRGPQSGSETPYGDQHRSGKGSARSLQEPTSPGLLPFSWGPVTQCHVAWFCSRPSCVGSGDRAVPAPAPPQ